MMKIKPRIEEVFEAEVVNDTDLVNTVSQKLLNPETIPSANAARVIAQKSLIRHGMGIESTASQLANLARNTHDDGVRLRCIEQSFKIHKVVDEDAEKSAGTQIQILISGHAGINVDTAGLQKMLNPER